MPFKPGDPKPAGSGMKKDQTTTKVQARKTVQEYLEGRNVDALGELVDLVFGKDAEDRFIPQERAQLILKILEYVYPKKKAIEHTGLNGTDIFAELLKKVGSEKE